MTEVIGQVYASGVRVTRPLRRGDSVKVWLPGESPWATVLEIRDGGFLGRLDNHPASDLHGYRFGQNIWFTLQDDCWQPAEHMR